MGRGEGVRACKVGAQVGGRGREGWRTGPRCGERRGGRAQQGRRKGRVDAEGAGRALGEVSGVAAAAPVARRRFGDTTMWALALG